MLPFHVSNKPHTSPLPCPRVYRYLKVAILKRRVAVGAPIYLSAVLEYLCAEVLELAGNAARDNKKKIITPRHILLAVANDDELHRVSSLVSLFFTSTSVSSLSCLVASWCDHQPGRCSTTYSRGAALQEEPAAWCGQTSHPSFKDCTGCCWRKEA